MLSNYFTFLHCAQLLNERYADSVIAEVYSQEKNTLCIVLYTPEPHTLVISCEPRKNFILARAGEIRSRKNSIDLFPAAINAHLVSAYVDSTDRIVYLELSNGLYFLIEMFGAKANILLCNQEGRIVDAFLSKKVTVGEKRTLQQKAQKVSVDDFVPEKNFFIQALQNSSEKSIAAAVKKIIPKLSSTLATEILHCSNVAADVQQQKLSVSNCAAVYERAHELVSKMLHAAHRVNPLIYFSNTTPAVFSLLPLQHCASLRAESYDDLFTGIQKFISAEKSVSAFEQEKKEIQSWIGKELEKTSRTIHSIELELHDTARAEHYETSAKLLLSNLQKLSKGMKSIELENSFSNNEVVVITLDSSLSPAQNAERYFEKAKKSKTKREEARERLVLLRQRYNDLERFNAQLNNFIEQHKPDLSLGKAGISFKNFLNLYKEEFHRLGFMTEQEQKKLPPFKIFTVDGGFTVYAGKNSGNNDLLTMKYAKSNDLWFHARGSSGSHVVLKVGSGDGTPSKKAIHQAAAIAAYYSKMKNAKNVPIAMVEKKFVRKPKGATAGTVVIEREKVIFVEPGLPG